MNSIDYIDLRHVETKVLSYAGMCAFILEFILLTAVGWNQHWLAHPQKTTGLDASKFIEAEVFQMPKEAVLHDIAKVQAPVHEVTLSKTPDQGRKAEPEENKLSDENKTESGPPLAPSHGPIAIYSPPPEIPEYLKNQDLKTSVVIDFFVSAQSALTVQLVNSSGNEELDAIAIRSVKTWKFHAAEKDHKAIDSKVRLRILFDVH